MPAPRVLAASVLAVCVLAAAPAAAPAGRVTVHLTTADGSSSLARRADVRFRPGRGRGPGAVVVRPAVGYQRLTAGFGVALTDTSAALLRRSLPARLRDQVMRRLFSSRRGIGLSYVRVPMGASDYVVGRPYTYDDQPAGRRDPGLTGFSLRHDEAYILPALRQALALNPRITVMANPWSPPAWMKADDSLIPTGPTASTLRPDAYGPLATYLVKVLQGYRAAGVPVRQLGVQNEPLNTRLTQSFPQMLLRAPDEARLIRDHVAPALRRAHLSPELLIWDYTYPRGLLGGTPEARAYIPTVVRGAGRDVDAIALHCYVSDAGAGTELHRRHPGLAQYETECSSYLSQIEPAQMAIRVLRNWAQGVQLWNAAVDQDFGPKLGQGCQGLVGPHAGLQCIAPVIVDTPTRTYRLTSDFFQLGQFSRFIGLGARRIASTSPSDCHDGSVPLPSCGLEDVAFRNRDGTRVLVATTHDGRPRTLTVTEGRRHFSYRLPDGATATFTWRPA